uniref:Uncharacterized protein n=1 Tax=Anguilla anguilla TaxID=7936 RepID=A0A0E9TH34_ANGAN
MHFNLYDFLFFIKMNDEKYSDISFYKKPKQQVCFEESTFFGLNILAI